MTDADGACFSYTSRLAADAHDAWLLLGGVEGTTDADIHDRSALFRSVPTADPPSLFGRGELGSCHALNEI